MDAILRPQLKRAVERLEQLICFEAGAQEPGKELLQARIDEVERTNDKFIDKYKLPGVEELHATMIQELDIAAKLERAECLLWNLKEASLPEGRSENSSLNSSNCTYHCNSFSATTLPKFSGDQSEWHNFWHIFNALIGSKSMPDIEKLSILMSHLGGEAKRIVSHYTVCGSSYGPVVDRLKRQYAQPEVQFGQFIKELVDLSRIDDVSSLERGRKLLNVLANLDRLGDRADVDSLMQLIIEAAPTFARERLISGKLNKDYRSLREVVVMLETEIQIREQLEEATVGSSKLHDRDFKAVKEEFSVRSKRFPSNQEGVERKVCVFCGMRNHPSEGCRKVSAMTDRKNLLRNKGLCFRCLRQGHIAQTCRGNRCRRCNSNHHLAICDRNKVVRTVACNHHQEIETYLMTLKVKVTNPTDPTRSAKVTVLFDNGAQATYVDDALVNRLGLVREERSDVSIRTFGSGPKSISSHFVSCRLGGEGRHFIIRGVVIKNMLGCVPHMDILQRWDGDRQFNWKPEQPVKTERPLIIIGMDWYHQFVASKPVRLRSGYYIYHTPLGRIFAGAGIKGVGYKSGQRVGRSYHVNCVLSNRFDISEFWNLENIGIETPDDKTSEDHARQYFEETLAQTNDGSYQVRFPWKNGITGVPENYGLALGRLKSTVSNLRSRNLMERYNEILEDQRREGIIEEVPKESVRPADEARVSYIPHHPVISPKKIRIVYDASASSRHKPSLNELLLRGPSQIANICAILLRARFARFVLVADVEKAFHQLVLDPNDRDVTRFLWLRNVNGAVDGSNLKVYRFTRVPFGYTCSPFLLNETISHHFKKIDFKFRDDFLDDIYVDNVLMRIESEDEALNRYQFLKNEFGNLRMNITGFTCNSKSVMEIIPEADRAIEWNKEYNLLGIQWNVIADTMDMKLQKPTCLATKRQLLAWIASQFDPLGLIFPVLLPFKTLLQELWQLQIGWDDPMPGMVSDALDQLIRSWEDGTISVSRFVASAPEMDEVSLHAFADASAACMASAIYIRFRKAGLYHTSLLMAKGRVMPVQRLTIPRAELVAVVLAYRLLNYVEANLRLHVDARTIWTDATAVLYWLKSRSRISKVKFIENRLRELTKFEGCFRHVPSELNPADLGSRGCTVSTLKRARAWWSGPAFLCEESGKWPKNTVASEDDATEFEVGAADAGRRNKPAWQRVYMERKIVNSILTSVEGFTDELSEKIGPSISCSPDQEADEEQRAAETRSKQIALQANTDQPEVSEKEVHSTSEERFFDYLIRRNKSYNQLVKIITYVKRFISKLKLKKEAVGGNMEGLVAEETLLEPSVERREAKRTIAMLDQQTVTPLEIRKYSLKLEDGIYKFKGRTGEGLIYIPRNSPLLSLVIMDIHQGMYHASAEAVNIRFRRQFWSPRGFNSIRKFIRMDCRVCLLDKKRTFREPDMCCLPSSRVTRSRPFEHVGLDVAGPFKLNGGSKLSKRWVLLCTCFTTRALHLEVLSDMSGYTLLLAMRRIMSTRGTPKTILTDNGTNFRLAFKLISQRLNWGVNWKFTAEQAPWTGGLYERMVQSLKVALRRSMATQVLSDDEFRTIVMEIASAINQRPLGEVHVGDELIVRPCDLLSDVPPIIFELESPLKEHCYEPLTWKEIVCNWRYDKELKDKFWNIWETKYIGHLRSSVWKHPNPRSTVDRAPIVGELVYVVDGKPPYRKGRILELGPSRDGITRSATIKLGTGHVTRRPVRLLAPLELGIT